MGQKQIHSTEAESFQHKLQRAANEEFSLESAHSRVRRRGSERFSLLRKQDGTEYFPRAGTAFSLKIGQIVKFGRRFPVRHCVLFGYR